MIRTKSNQWQVRIEMCKLLARGLTYETNCVYGDTTDLLQQAVKAYLLYETKLLRFSNVGDHLVGRMIYFYSNGISLIEDPITIQKLLSGVNSNFTPSKKSYAKQRNIPSMISFNADGMSSRWNIKASSVWVENS